MTDDQGHIVFTNTDIWDVLVDMAYYYNFAVDTRIHTEEMLDYPKKLREDFEKQQKEIEAIKKDDLHQWKHIKVIEEVNDKQQSEIDLVLNIVSCFSEGRWINALPWSDDTVWDNNIYAITDALDADIKAISENHKKDIEAIYKKLAENEMTFNDLVLQNNKEHELINKHLKQHDKQIQDLQKQLTEQDEQLADLLDTLACFNNGYWDNGLKWSNKAFWENSNLVYDTFDTILSQIGGPHTR